jgi:hypothetical protein
VALLSFPSNPSNGQLYPINPVIGQNQYQWSSTEQIWKLLGPAIGVAPGCYGNSTNVATFCVDAQGRVTSVTNVPIAANTPNLQQVTTQGAVTTDTIDVGGLVAAGLTYPNVDGASGDYLTTDGTGNLGWVTPATPDLQAVTDVGSTTTNTINVGAIVAASLIYPIVDGASGDYLITDGAGNLSWTAPSATPDLNAVTTAGNLTANSIEVGGLTAAGVSYPSSDGLANQVLSTNGAGSLGWVNTATVVAPPSTSFEPGNDDEIAFDALGHMYFYKGGQWWIVDGTTFFEPPTI